MTLLMALLRRGEPDAASVTLKRAEWALYRGTRILSRHATEAACAAAAAALGVTRRYTCRTTTTIDVRMP